MHDLFDPLSPEFIADPYPFLSQLREEAPVAYSPDIGMWMVSRHEDVHHVFSHPELFSASIAQAPLMALCDEAMGMLKKDFHITPVMSNADPPVHTRVRKRLARAFSVRRMAMLAPVIEERCARLLDGIAPRGRGDLAKELCYPLPAVTIFTMIGFPDQDADQIKAWCADKLVVNWGRPSKEDQIRAAETMIAFWRYCAAFVARRRVEPADDMTTDLMTDSDRDEPLTDQEITSIIFGLSFAGHETTTNLAANCIRRVIENGLWPRLRDDRDLIGKAVEETLRHDSSVLAWRRIAKEDTVVGGVEVPKGAKLCLWIGAANRDPRVFDNPDAFAPERAWPKDHLSFGKGIHFCLGSHLARLEVSVILRQMLDRFATLEFDGNDPLPFTPNIAFRGPIELKARWTPVV